MRKFILIAAALIGLSQVSVAQSAKKGDFNIGITAGAGLANTRQYNGGEKIEDYGKYEKHGIANIQAGLVVDYAFIDNFFLESGLTFQRKGTKTEYNYSDGNVEIEEENTANLFYLQLPILLNYKFDFGNVSLAPQVGPYFAFGIGGKTISESNSEAVGKLEIEDESKEDSFGDESGLKRFDLGLRFAAGLGIGENARISIGYDLGLANIMETEFEETINGVTIKQEIDAAVKNGSFFGAFTYYFK